MNKLLKKVLATLLTLLLLCGSTSQLTWAAEESPAPEAAEVSAEESESPEAGPFVFAPEILPQYTDDGPHGLIMLTQDQSRCPAYVCHKTSSATVQIYTVDPDTCEQKLWSEFRQPYPAVDMNCITSAGGNRNQFNYNFTKMAVDQVNPNLADSTNIRGYCHAGWIDENGEFFDVNKKLDPNGTIFADQAFSGGFYGSEDTFVFDAAHVVEKENGHFTLVLYACYATVEEINQGIYHRYEQYEDSEIRETYCNYRFSKDLLSSYFLDMNEVRPYFSLMVADRIELDRTIFLADYLPSEAYSYWSFFPVKNPTSFLYDTNTGQPINYLPDGYYSDNKSEWGSVLSPDGTTVAYLTMPGSKGKASMEFVDISQFIASGFNPAMRGTPVKVELADGPIKVNDWHVFDYYCEDPSCMLLAWRP